MSIIMTAGKNKVNWSPKAKQDEGLTKTASTEEVVEASDEDMLFEAAKSFIEAGKDKKCEDCECDPCECEKKDEKETKEACGMADEEAVVLDIDEVSDEVSDEAPEGEVFEEAADSVEEAVEKVEEAVEELKEVVEGDESPEDEIAEVEIEVVDEEPVAEEGDIFVESEPECCEACGATMASSGEEFVRYAAISPANRKKLRQYWKGMLNYVPDYVDLMTKDYE